MLQPDAKFGAPFAARYAGRTVLALGAHPDDLELGIGGTIARLARCGARVVMAMVSVPASYEVRRGEAERAARILGGEPRFLVEGGCRRIEDFKSYELVALLDALVADLSPAAVLTHGPTDFHRDHVLVYNAALAAQRMQHFDFFSFHPTMVRPVPVQFHPRAYVDISDTIELKLEAIAAHASQFGRQGACIEMYRDMARLHGRMVGVEYAEGLDVNRMLLS